MPAPSRFLFEQRGRLVADWAERIAEHPRESGSVPAALFDRQLRLVVDLVAEMAGPLRRETRELWERGCEQYGRTAAARGLAAGEVVDELSALREVLTRDLAASVAALPARQALATLLHLNRVLDRGTTVAVAGYTDALVASLMAQDGVPSAGNELESEDVDRQLTALQGELVSLTAPPSERM